MTVYCLVPVTIHGDPDHALRQATTNSAAAKHRLECVSLPNLGTRYTWQRNGQGMRQYANLQSARQAARRVLRGPAIEAKIYDHGEVVEHWIRHPETRKPSLAWRAANGK